MWDIAAKQSQRRNSDSGPFLKMFLKIASIWFEETTRMPGRSPSLQDPLSPAGEVLVDFIFYLVSLLLLLIKLVLRKLTYWKQVIWKQVWMMVIMTKSTLNRQAEKFGGGEGGGVGRERWKGSKKGEWELSLYWFAQVQTSF